jgi:predicted 3-demethylubiquinone-9 3-methyltransferase (glyoxalase superfamily)
MPKVSTFLWFDDQAEDAADLYVSLLGGSIGYKRHWGPGGPAPEGSLMSVQFTLDGHEYQAFNGGPGHPFSDSHSIFVEVEDQAELDRVWDALVADGGRGVACGWLADRFGLSWQIIPKGFGELLEDPDPGRSSRALQAMLSMVKIDLAAMRAAADAEPSAGMPTVG